MRSWRCLVVVASLGGLSLSAIPQPAVAVEKPRPGIELDVGWSGRYHPGEGMPVRVRVAADRLVRGDLEVSVDTQGFMTVPSVVVAVEVPGGSTKEYLVVVPTAIDPVGVDVVASLEGSGLVEGRSRVESAGDTELVGLLPGVLDGRPLPGTAPLAVDVGTAQFSAVDPAALATPGALSSLDVLGVAPGELGSLGSDAKAEVLAWIAGGGRLLADEPTGSDVAGLPASWQPGEAGRSRAGHGEVRSTDGAMAAGAFTGLVEPTPARRTAVEGFGNLEPMDATLAFDAGLRIPQLSWLVGFLLAYVLVAVPLTLTVLRRMGRGELGWLVLPLVSLAFTGVGYLAGRDLRNDAVTSHGTVLTLTDVGARATTHLGAVSNAGGTVATTFPASWSVVPSGNQFSGPTAPVAAGQTNDGLELRQRLQPGQFGITAATGPVPLEGGLEITATATGDRIEGKIRSTLPFDLEDVGVLQGQNHARVGSLAAGGEATFQLSLGDHGDPFMGPARELWREAAGFDRPPDRSGIVALALWDAFEAHAPAGFRSAGSVVVGGWTRDFAPPVSGAPGALKGRTLVVSTAAVASEGPAEPGAVRTELVRSAVSHDGGFSGGSFLWRFTAPAGGDGFDTAALAVRAPQQGLALDVWRDGAWQPLEADGGAPADVAGPRDFEGFLGPSSDRRLPAGAAGGGVLWIRGTPREDGHIDPFLIPLVDAVTVRGAA